MYDELVKRLRSATTLPVMNALCQEAANAIEELSAENESLAKSVNEASEILRKRWTPVTERLPKGADKSGELCENAWLFFDDGNVYPGWMNGITEKVYYLGNYSGSLMTAPIGRVKMWQPRPEPPKEE